MLAPAPTAPSSRSRRVARTVQHPAPTHSVAPAEAEVLASRHHPGPATVEELVARDIGAFSRRRPR